MEDLLKIANGLLELFTRLGVNPLYVVAIVFFTTVLKSFDPKDRFKQGYVVFPLIIGLAVCRMDRTLAYDKWIVQSLVHASLGAYGYMVYAKLFKKDKKTPAKKGE